MIKSYCGFKGFQDELILGLGLSGVKEIIKDEYQANEKDTN